MLAMTQPPPGDDPYETVDLDELITRDEPLANLIKVLQLSNTWRDSSTAIAEDLSIALKARDGVSEISRAISQYEESRTQRGRQAPAEQPRRDLAAEILNEIRPAE